MGNRFAAAGFIAAALLMLTGLGCGARGDDPSPRTADHAFEAADQKRRLLDTAEDRLGVVEAFLEEFPDSRHSPQMAWLAAYYRLELGDAEAGFTYVDEIRNQISDPEIVYQLDRRMMPLYGKGGEIDRMLAIAEVVDEREGLGFGGYGELMAVAEEAGRWQAVLELAERAQDLATADAFRNDYPNEELSDEQVAEAVGNRRAMVESRRGWAVANLGRLDEALAAYSAAAQGVRTSYIGVPRYDLNQHWGKTLLMQGNHAEALERLALEGLILNREDAVAGMKQAYVGLNGGTSGFDEYARTTRAQLARTIDDFSLPDYDGQRHSLDSLRGEATLLAFWFPT